MSALTLVQVPDTQTVIVHDGMRGRDGAQGPQGDQGPQGADGAAINVLGDWVSGAVYSPNDAVTYDSTAAAGIKSLYVQIATHPTSPSTIPPRDDPGRWAEIGATDLSAVTGAIWTVQQAAHGFTQVGTPVYFDGTGYRAASAADVSQLAIAIVREVRSTNEFVLQTTGEITALDPTLITPPAASFTPGTIYYVAANAGQLALEPPSGSGGYSNPVLVATAGTAGVVVPWRPIKTVIANRTVGQVRFYYTALADQFIFDGPDERGNTLSYVPGPNTGVYRAGVLQREPEDYTATDGTSIQFVQPFQAGTRLQVVTADQDPALVVPTAGTKLEDIAGQFNGITVTFDLKLVGGADFQVTAAENLLISLDGIIQESYTDYTMAYSAPVTSITFLAAPYAGQRFWGVAGLPS